MPLSTRSLSGTVRLGNNASLAEGVLTALPVGVMPTSEDGQVLLAQRVEYPIAGGTITPDIIVAGAVYEFTVYDDAGREVLPPFRAPVSADVLTPIDFEDLYTTANTALPPGMTLEDALGLYQLRAERGIAGGYAPLDSAGKLPLAMMPEGAGTGDMQRDDYDTDLDGKVNIAEEADHAAAADAVPWAGVTGKPATFPPDAHTHDDRYYTEAEADALLTGKAPAVHTHDDRYYTEAEADALLAGKSNTGHAHSGADITSGIVPAARLGSGSPSSLTVLYGDGTWGAAPAGGATPWLIVAHTEAAAVDGGTFNQGGENPRPLTQLIYNGSGLPDGDVFTPGASQTPAHLFELPAGTYYVEAWGMGKSCSFHQVIWRCTDGTMVVHGASTASTASIYGSGEMVQDATPQRSKSTLSGVFTIAAVRQFQLVHWCRVPAFNDGYGGAVRNDLDVNYPNRYAEVKIWKL